MKCKIVRVLDKVNYESMERARVYILMKLTVPECGKQQSGGESNYIENFVSQSRKKVWELGESIRIGVKRVSEQGESVCCGVEVSKVIGGEEGIEKKTRNGRRETERGK